MGAMQEKGAYLELFLALFKSLSSGRFAALYEQFGNIQLLVPCITTFR